MTPAGCRPWPGGKAPPRHRYPHSARSRAPGPEERCRADGCDGVEAPIARASATAIDWTEMMPALLAITKIPPGALMVPGASTSASTIESMVLCAKARPTATAALFS